MPFPGQTRSIDEPAQERHWHWDFLAFNEADRLPNGSIQFMVSVSVIGFLCEEDATLAARDILRRDCFHLNRVWECNTCGHQSRMAETMRKFAEAAGG